MKLHLELIRYSEDEMDWKKRGRIALVFKLGARHLDVMADEDEMFDLDSVSAAIDVLRDPNLQAMT